ncbi:unnamed protein product [Soboliphyme baturini]|uniref:Tubulin-specific chaperone A n=1 Tax=Soboliphyme baturini TaxID=241478 RepID=A0A183IBF4_9BILA|nr:unnamed protein product [Soboliphyme baturini]
MEGLLAMEFRDIKIQTGVINRLIKEKACYEKETMEQKAKVEKMTTDGVDEYVIKKQKEIVVENESMIALSIRRLDEAVKKMQQAMEGVDKTSENEIIQKAVASLKEAEKVIAMG